MKANKHILTLALIMCSALSNLFAVEKSYYNSLDGKSGTTLREALTTLTYTKHTTDLGYNWTFDGIDIVNGEILDIYSTCSWTTGQQGKNYSDICDGYNREHVVPQSLFHEAAPQKGDRHHLFLADGQVNNLRSSHPFGETNITTAFNGYSNGNKALGKLGTASSGYTGTVYEPDDEYKGDIARAVLYMAVRYATSDVCRKYNGTANSYPVTAWNNAMFSGSLSTNYGLSNNAIAIFLKWHRADPPSAKEIARNNGVEKKQGNRNPFVDLPDLVEYLWGNHAGETVNLSSLNIATGGGSVPTTYEITLSRNGITETATCSGTYTLPSTSEADACDGWAFAGWTTSSDYNSTTAPSYTKSVNSATTLYAVYSNSAASSAPHRSKMAASTVTFTAGTDTSDGTTLTKDGVTISLTSGTLSRTDNYRVYASNSMTISSSSGNISKIEFTISQNTFTTNVGTWTNDTKTWSGDASSITFSASGGQVRITKIVVTLNSSGSGGGSTTTYKTTPDCGSAHDITLSSGGSVTGGTFEASATSAYKDATITLYAEPSDGYIFESWTVTNNSTSEAISVTDNQFTMPDANVTISATFSTPYTIRFYNNGSLISSQSVYAGSKPNVPAIEGCEGYTFVGWWTNELGENNTTVQTWVTDFTVTKAQDYYAIFSKTVGGAGGGSTQKSIYLDQDSVSSSYGTDTEVTRCGVTCYYTNVMKSTSGTTAIQMKKSGSYIANKESLTKIDSIIINGVTTLTVYGGTSVKPETTTITRSNNKYDFSGGNYSYFKIKNATSGALYPTNIKIYYTVSGGSNSSTTYYTSTTTCAAACTTLDAPSVTATPGNGQITLSWPDVTGADHYTVTISKGAGYTTECGSAASIGTISHSGTTNTCVITGLTNGLAYTTTVVANASSSTCDSEADSDTTTPQECTQWDDPTLGWNKYKLNTTTDKTATKTLSGTTHGTLSFESSNTDVLTVDSSTGTVTAQGAGEATVTAHWTAADGYCEKTMTSQAFEVAGPLTINFDANGGTGTMTDQTVTYKVSTVIKDNSFTRTGYTFLGWALTADGEKVYDDKQGVAFTNSLTLYAVWMLNSHKVTFTPAPTGATVKVNNSSTSPVNNVNYGSTVTIAITPAEHYTISTVSIQGATSHNEIAQTGSGETRTFTMPDENVNVTVTMNAESTYTATFYNNGTQYGESQTGYADDDVTAPTTNPEACDESFTFVGWVAAEQTTETTSMPEVLTFPQTMPSGNVSYYALYRRVEGSGGGEASVTFKKASSDASTAYTDDSDIKANLVESYTGISSFAGSKAYLGKSGVKLGASGGSGYITLNLSSPITTNTITVHAAQYGSDTGDLQIDVNGSNSFGSELSPADGTLTFTNSSDVEITDLTVSTTNKRAYVASISLGGGGTSYYTTAPVCAPCEYKVTLTKGAESHGSFTLNKANGTYDNCKTNFIVTVSGITPDEGYYCSGVTATGGAHVIVAGPDGSGNYMVSYNKGNNVTSTITANFEEIPTHTVTWSVLGGEEISSATYREGATIAFPADPTGCEDKEFVGWTTEPILLTDDAPSFVNSATMGTSDITYYAVFATASEGAPMLTNNYKKITSTSELTDGNYLIVAYYNNGYKAMSTTWKDTYYLDSEDVTPSDDVITTTDGTIIWNIAVSNNQATIYNATSGYLHIEKSGSYYNIKLGDNTTANKFTYSVSSGNWLFTSVTYTDRVLEYYSSRTRWAYYTAADAPVYLYKQQYASGTTTYSGYTTLCYEKYERTFNNVEDYATLCLPYSVNVLYLQGATAYSVAGKYVNNSTITGILLNEEETELAAGQSYVIQSTALTMNAWYSPRVDSLKAPVDTQGMVGNLSGKKIYVPVGCYGLSHNKLRKVASENTASIDHYKAYFVLNDDEEVPVVEESAIPQGSKVMHTTDDAPTALEQTNGQLLIDWNQPVYNILGIRVGKDATGVLIQNGIKYLR